MLQTKALGNWNSGFGKKIFIAFYYVFYVHSSHLGHVTKTIRIFSIPTLHIKFETLGFCLCFCHFPMWYPGSGVVLDCIDS